jgi:hypothetical protein
VNVQLLIDSIVRQTTVLIAQLATAGGARAPLSNVANQVFLDLVDELHQQGVSRKVSASMFGLALRTYFRKIQRLRESTTEGGRSLWEAILEFLSEGRLVTRTEVLSRFHRDDPDLVRGVLHDLAESGLVMRLGSGKSLSYRAATPEELDSLSAREAESGTDELVWAIIYREGPLSLEALRKVARANDLEGILSRLVSDQRITKDDSTGTALYSSRRLFVQNGAATGWEAAVLDHFQAMVQTIIVRLGGGGERTSRAPEGGSTYTYGVWPGHPLEGEVLSQLDALRQRASELRNRVSAYNAAHRGQKTYTEVTLYFGQLATEIEEDSQ